MGWNCPPGFIRGMLRAGLCRGAGLMVHTRLAGGSVGSVSLSKLLSSLLQAHRQTGFVSAASTCSERERCRIGATMVLLGGKSRELSQTRSTWEQIHEMTSLKKKFRMPECCDSSFQA